MFQKLLARQVALVDPLFLEAFDHFRFGRDRSMVGTRHPARVLAFQARTTNQYILYRLVQHMSHMQHTRHIRRWDHYRVRFLLTTICIISIISIIIIWHFRMKQLIVQPILVPTCLNFCRIIFTIHIFVFIYSLLLLLIVASHLRRKSAAKVQLFSDMRKKSTQILVKICVFRKKAVSLQRKIITFYYHVS